MSSTPTTPPVPAAQRIDPRGPRFGAGITAALLAAVLVLGPASAVALVLLLVQTMAFAAGSLLGLHAQPWGVVYRRLVRPRLAPPVELEDSRPPRFAQSVGLAFALAALAGILLALPVLFYVAVAFALVAALLNAVFDFCLGCEVYLLVSRLRRTRAVGSAG